jgi:subtilase family serine protease
MPAADSGWATEIALDVEWAHAMAPAANILLVEANSANDSDLYTAVQYAASQPGVAVVSMSWGGSEYSGETSDDSVFTTPAGHPGVVFVASSGDSGAPPEYPAISPNVLSVGGTSLYLNSSNNWSSETDWSGSGGGISAYEPLPSYQPSTYSNGAMTGTSTMRTSPDVAYDANPSTGFPEYNSYSYPTAPWQQFGGTSDAAPQWAALVAITDQGRQLAGESNLNGASQLLPMIYQMPSSNFHDITSGTSTGSPNYSAGPGYDLTTGRGSPIANLVVASLVGAPTAPVAPTGLTATATSSSQINLSWNADSGASNGYLIERSPNGSTGWTQIGTTAAGVTTYSDIGLAANTTYYYEVIAVNAVGDSPASNIANATTQGSSSNSTPTSPPPTSQPPTQPTPTPQPPTPPPSSSTPSAFNELAVDASFLVESYESGNLGGVYAALLNFESILSQYPAASPQALEQAFIDDIIGDLF